MIEYNCYKKFSDISQEFLFPDKLKHDWEQACSYYKEKIYPEYTRLNEYRSMYLRVVFEESEDVAWDSMVLIRQSDVEENNVLITVFQGTMNEEYEISQEQLIINPSTELYKFILNAYLEGYPKE